MATLTAGLCLAVALPSSAAEATGAFDSSSIAEADQAVIAMAEVARSQASAGAGSVNYVPNAGFDLGASGWMTADSTKMSVGRVGRRHSAGARLKPWRGGKVLLQTTLASSGMDVEPGDSFVAGAWVRSKRRYAAGWLTVYSHTANTVVEGQTKRAKFKNRRWHYVTLRFVAHQRATNIRLNIGATGLKHHGKVLVDDVTLTRAGDRTLVDAGFDRLPAGQITPGSLNGEFPNTNAGASALTDISVADDTRGHGKVMRTGLQAGTIVSQPSGQPNGIVVFPGLGTAVTNACISYDVRFDPQFDWSLGGKLPGLSGVAPGVSPSVPSGGNYAGDQGWSGRMMWLGPRAYSWAGPDNMAVSYMYSPGQAGRYGDNLMWNSRFVAGQWHTVKQCYVMNTVGASDGRLMAWMDGRLTLSVDNYEYRTRNDVGINYIAWNVFRGGADLAWAGSHNDYIDFDNVLVTAE